jgi:hypothetical protein
MLKNARHFYLIILSLIFLISSQNLLSQESTKESKKDSTKVKLLDAEFSKYMNLDSIQIAKITPKIDSLKAIEKSEKESRDQMRAKMQSGERPDRDEMMKMRETMEKSRATMKSLIESIQSYLTSEQLEKFKNVETPTMGGPGRPGGPGGPPGGEPGGPPPGDRPE